MPGPNVVIPAGSNGWPSGQTFKGVWDQTGSTNYHFNDTVVWNGTTYICAVSNTSIYPNNTTYWIAQPGDPVNYDATVQQRQAMDAMTARFRATSVGDDPLPGFGEFQFGT